MKKKLVRLAIALAVLAALALLVHSILGHRHHPTPPPPAMDVFGGQ
jgi:hypothetical protein